MGNDYRSVYNNFNWNEAYYFLGLSERRERNIAEALNEKYGSKSGNAVIRVDSNWNKESITWPELFNKASRLAAYLKEEFKVGKGDVVAFLASRKIEQVIGLMAITIIGAVNEPLFTAFGPKAIEIRISDLKPKVMLVQQDQCGKLKEISSLIKGVKVISFPGKCNEIDSEDFEKAISYDKISEYTQVGMDEMTSLIYTSGTTGPPKGVMINKRQILSLYVYTKYGLGISEDDVFFNGADPGWAYGLGAGIMSSLLFGKTVLFLDSPFSPYTLLQFLEALKVTNFTHAPTAYRLIMGTVKDVNKYNIKLKKASSAGEPLNPEIVKWFMNNFGIPVKDHYGQTESGMIIFNGWGYDAEYKPGSSGLPAPGYKVTIIKESENDEDGVIAVNTKSEGFYFMGYLNAPEKTKAVFKGEWYLTNDVAKVDSDGYFWFVARADDVVKVSGYRISPFEIESVLLEHPAVMESAVIGIPDPVRGNVLKAFVTLKKGYEPSDKLAKELIEFVRTRYAKHVHLEQIEFVESLPKTEAGKVQKYKLKGK